MKVFPLLVVSVILGGGLGAALAYVSVGPASESVVLEPTLRGAAGDDAAALGPASETPAPEARIEEPDFEFGTMQRGTSMSHNFRVFNEGDAPLVLTTGETTCKCTEFKTAPKPIPPGESATVKLEWAAKVAAGPFRQTAQLHTTDPRRELIVLSVSGEVIDATGLTPQEFHLGRVSTKNSDQASVVLMAFDQEDLQVTATIPSDGEARAGGGVDRAERYRVDVVPLEPADFPDERAKAAVRVDLTAEPGLPVGVIYDWVTLHTNLPSAQQMQVPIYGRVEGDISIHGFGWSAETGVLALGVIKSNQGKKAKLRISIKNPEAASAKLSVKAVDPPELEVDLGDPKPIREGVVHVPMTIEVPVGTRPMVRLHTGLKPDGSYQHPQGEIRLESNLPDTPELVILVRLAVRDASR